MIGKEKLNFDNTDAETLDASDSIGSYTRSGSSGALITNHSSLEAGTVTFTFADGDVTVGTDTINETGHGMFTGDIVQLSSTGTLPAGLSAATNYYAIRVDDDNFKLADTPGEAETGTAIDITAAAGGGTHTLTEQDSERRSLDVYFTNPTLEISATDLDIRDLVFATDKVDVSGSEVSLDAATLAALETTTVEQGTSPWVIGDGGGSITVDATDLDIRDLAFATDSVDVSGSEVSLDAATLAALETVTVEQGTSPWVIGDGGGSITVDAVDLDIRDLDAASDSVESWTFDGTGNAITSTASALDVNIQSSDIEIDVEDDKANTALNSTQKDVSATGALLVSQLADRRFMWVQNLGNKNVFIGEAGVTAADGIRMSPGSVAEFRFGPALSLHAVSAAGTQDFRILEAS